MMKLNQYRKQTHRKRYPVHNNILYIFPRKVSLIIRMTNNIGDNLLYYISIQLSSLPEYLSVKDILRLKVIAHSMDNLLETRPNWRDFLIRDHKIQTITENNHSITIKLKNNHVISFPKDMCQKVNKPIDYQRIYQLMKKSQKHNTGIHSNSIKPS